MSRVIGCLALVWAAVGHAAPFQEAFVACRDAYENTRYQEALDCFRALEQRAKKEDTAVTREARPHLRFYIGLSHFKLNDYAAALPALREALTLQTSPTDANEIRKQIELIEANHCGTVNVKCAQGYTASLHGRILSCPARFEVVPRGQADLLLKRDGAFKGQQTITVQANQEQTVELAEASVGDAGGGGGGRGQKGVDPKAVTGWILIGLGAAAGAVGYYFHSEESDARDDYTLARDAGMADEANGYREEVADWQTYKGLTWIGGGILAAAGIGLVIWAAVDEDDPPVKAWIGPGSVGFGGRF